MLHQNYSFSFTTSSLRRQETVKLAQLYLHYRDWNAVRDHTIQNNILQQRTTISSKRLCRELLSRLRLLSPDELVYLVKCPESEKPIILWVAVCRRYRFIHDFTVEILKEHYLKLSQKLDYSDFEVFFSSKLCLHREMEGISLSTRRKARQVIFTMLREVGLLSGYTSINHISPKNETLKLLDRQDREVIGLLESRDFAIANTE